MITRFMLFFSALCFSTDAMTSQRNPFAVINLSACNFDSQWHIIGIAQSGQQHCALFKHGPSATILSLSIEQYLPDTVWQLKQIEQQSVLFQRDTSHGCPQGQQVIDLKWE